MLPVPEVVPEPRVVVALQDGFHGATSGSGFSNRALLEVLAETLPHRTLYVLPVNSVVDRRWHTEVSGRLESAGAQVRPIGVSSVGQSTEERERLCRRVAAVADQVADGTSQRVLLIALDVALLGVGQHLRASNLDMLLVPRSTSALDHPGDLGAIHWEQTVLRHASANGGQIAAISDHMRTHLNRAYGVPDRAMVDLPNGLLLNDRSATAMTPVPQLPLRARAGFLLAMGRAVPTKGFEDLVRALGILRRTRVQLPHLVLAATSRSAHPTPHQRQLAELVRGERLDATVLTRFSPDVRSLLASPALRCVVVPSRSEAFGRIPLEAFAAGSGPVVASRAGGLAQTVLDGVTGFTAEPNDPTSLAQAIERALRVTVREREQLLRAGRDLLHERHDYRLTIRRYLVRHVPWVLAPAGAVSGSMGGPR